MGGLGNQMFQYSYTKFLQEKGHEVKIDTTAFKTYKLHGGYQLDKYNIDLQESTKKENDKFYKDNIYSKVLRRVGIKTSKAVREKSLLFDEVFLNIEDDNYIEGYFQSEKYFDFIRDELLKDFTIKQELSDSAKEIKTIIESSKNSVSLHIRRGDYVANSHTNNVHGTCSLKYYDKAIQHLKSKIGDIQVFVFSDDIKWTKENLKYEYIYFVESDKKRIAHEDIYLMSLCNHNIIANSSFSWWGAWLNTNTKKIVIGPQNWFADEKMQEQSQDIVCESWVKI